MKDSIICASILLNVIFAAGYATELNKNTDNYSYHPNPAIEAEWQACTKMEREQDRNHYCDEIAQYYEEQNEETN